MHDTHANGPSRHSGRRTSSRPDLGRPSLFADFDQESVEDVEPQRIRLLSTLESQRGVRKRPRTRRQPTGRARPWLTRALMLLMALGMLVMLLSFVQLLRRAPPSAPPAQAMGAGGAVGTTAGTTASAPMMATATDAATEAAEIIDMSPPAWGPGPSTSTSALPLPPSTATTADTPSPTGVVAAAGDGPHVASAHASTVGAPANTEPDRGHRPVGKPAATRAAAKREAGASHDDVALVEAMLAHAGPRQVQPTPTAALQLCGTGNSPQAAVCRAKVCVQHPSLPACHAP